MKFNSALLANLAVIVTAVACSKVEFEHLKGPKCQGSGIECITVNGIDHFDYEVETDPPNLKTDILIVDDNSPSMRPEQQAMGDRISSLLNEISDLDWRIAITTTDVHDPSSNSWRKDGALLKFPNDNYYITKNTPNVLNQFLNTVVRPNGEGFGDERGIYAAYRSVERRSEFGFFRNDANLAVIVLSDEDERSNSLNDHDNPYDGPLASRDKANNFVSYLESLWPNKNITAHSIIIRPDMNPNQSGNQPDEQCFIDQDTQSNGIRAYYGHEYAKLSSLTGGVIGNICSTNYGNELSEIGQVTMNNVSSIKISCEPLDGSVEVYKQTQNGWIPLNNWSVSGKKIQFNPALAGGVTLRVIYDCTSIE